MAFAEPLALLFAGLLGVLVLFHLWEQRRQRVVVPSLLLWANLHNDRLTATRLRPDLLFFLRALILTLLIIGLARPYFPGPDAAHSGRRHVIIVDTSASMQTHEAGGTRFELARQEALGFLDGLPAEDEVLLLAAGHGSSVLVEFTRDHAALRQALLDVAPSDVGGDLSAALALANTARLRSDVSTEILVFTDLARSQLPASMRDQVVLFQNGSSDDNVGIESLQIHQGRFQEFANAQAQVQVRNFSAREVHGMLTVQVEDTIVERNGFSLQPLESRRYLTNGFPRAGKVTVKLEPNDAFSLDNLAYGWIGDARPLRVLLVSKATALVRDFRKLAPASHMRLTVVEPSAYNAGAAADADLVVFHRFAPEPPADTPLFTSSGEATSPEILDWDANHPALRTLQSFASEPLTRARVVTPPAGSEVLLKSRSGDREFPLAFAFERDGHRHACLSFDLEGEQVLRRDNLNLLMLVLNLFDWLAPQQQDVMIGRTGEATSLGLGTGALTAIDPRGQKVADVAIDATTAIIEPRYAGVYSLDVGGTKRTLLANFADPQESNIGRPREEPQRAVANPVSPLTASKPGKVAAPVNDFRVFPWLAALLLLVLEWLIATARQNTSASRVPDRVSNEASA